MSQRTFPASVGQRLLWFMEHYRGRAGVLNCPLLLRLRGRLDMSILQETMDRLTARHEALRTTFTGRGSRLTQVINDPGPVSIGLVDVSDEPDTDLALQRRVAAELRTQIDPTIWPVRVTLWRIGPDDHVICFNMHHLVADGWSCGVIFQEILRLYDWLAGGGSPLPAIGWQYSQFVAWQTEALQSETFRTHRDYWRRELKGVIFPSLPSGSVRAGDGAHAIGRDGVDLGPSVAAALRAAARARRTTIFTVMLSIYYSLLLRLAGDNDLAIASVFANRLRPELQHTVGALAHLIVLRARLRRAGTFGDVLREAHATVAGAFLHQDVPYHMIGGVELDPASNRAEDLVFQMVAKPLSRARVGGLDVQALEVDGMGQRFGFECAVFPIDDRFTVAVSYNESRIDPAFAREFVSQYSLIASQVAANPDVRLTALAA